MDQLKPTIFLDRDGILNVDHGYVFQVDQIEIPPGTSQALQELHNAGYNLIVITNQSGIARGMFTISDVEQFNLALKDKLEESWGFKILDFFVCPHHPDGSVTEFKIKCSCRKPEIGLIEAAQSKYPIELKTSYMIGDKKSDIDLAKNIGIPGIQVLTKYPSSPSALKVFETLPQAATYILSKNKK